MPRRRGGRQIGLFSDERLNEIKNNAILVTGGAGYIGNHVALALRESGKEVVVLDSLCRGFIESVGESILVEGAVRDTKLVNYLLETYHIDTIMHFAAFTIVPESVKEPLKYYENNTGGTRALLECALAHKVKHFVFSSTAAVYGVPADGVASEESALNPIEAFREESDPVNLESFARRHKQKRRWRAGRLTAV